MTTTVVTGVVRERVFKVKVTPEGRISLTFVSSPAAASQNNAHR